MTKKLYSTFALDQIKLKKIIFKIIGISNYLMQDYENDTELTEVQQLWKALDETIESILELIQHIYSIKTNELKYTDEELGIMKNLRGGTNVRQINQRGN